MEENFQTIIYSKSLICLQKQQEFISKSSFNTNSCHDHSEFLHFRLFLVSLRQMEFAFHMMS